MRKQATTNTTHGRPQQEPSSEDPRLKDYGVFQCPNCYKGMVINWKHFCEDVQCPYCETIFQPVNAPMVRASLLGTDPRIIVSVIIAIAVVLSTTIASCAYLFHGRYSRDGFQVFDTLTGKSYSNMINDDGSWQWHINDAVNGEIKKETHDVTER